VNILGSVRVAEIRVETMFEEAVVAETVVVVVNTVVVEVTVLFKSIFKISWSDNIISIFIKYLYRFKKTLSRT